MSCHADEAHIEFCGHGEYLVHNVPALAEAAHDRTDLAPDLPRRFFELGQPGVFDGLETLLAKVGVGVDNKVEWWMVDAEGITSAAASRASLPAAGKAALDAGDPS